MSLHDKLNAAVEKRQTREQHNYEEQPRDTETKQVSTLATNLRPSKYLPLRTANYWRDVEMAKMPNISFFKELENGKFEIHRNATKAWNNIMNVEFLHEVLRETAWELSYTGESDIALFTMGDKINPLKIDLIQKQYFPNGDLMYYHGLVNADTGTAPFILTKEFYFENEKVIMKNKPYEKTEDGWRNMDVKKFNKKYEQDILETVVLEIDQIPVITLTNTGADRWGSGESDWDKAQDILARLDIVEDSIDRAIKASKTRLWQKRKNGAMDLGGVNQRKNSTASQILDDVEVVDVVEDPHVDIDGNLQITDRSLNVQEWYQVRSSLMNEYMSHTGENVAADAHGNNQHTYEVQSRGDNKYRVATAKKTQRVKEISSLINIAILIAKAKSLTGFTGVDVVDVKIEETDIRTVYEIEEKVEKLMNLGLISKVQALMKLMDISEEMAIKMLSEKDKHDTLFEEEEPEMIQEQVEDEEVVEDTEEV